MLRRLVPRLVARGGASSCRSHHRPACSRRSCFAVPSSPLHLPPTHRAASLTTFRPGRPSNPTSAGGGLLSAARVGGFAARLRLGSGSRLLIRPRCDQSRPRIAFAASSTSRDPPRPNREPPRLALSCRPLTREGRAAKITTDAGHPAGLPRNLNVSRQCLSPHTSPPKTPTSTRGS